MIKSQDNYIEQLLKHYANKQNKYGHHLEYWRNSHHKNSSSVNLPPPPRGKFTDCVKFFRTVVTARRIGASPSFSLELSKLDDFTRKPTYKRIYGKLHQRAKHKAAKKIIRSKKR